MNTLMDSGWIQSIIGGLIASGLIVIGKILFANRYSYRQAIFSVSVATLVFCFGTVLEPAVKFFIEGDNVYWQFLKLLREKAPGFFVSSMLLSGLAAGIPTGLAVLRGTSFKQRVAYGAIWAPLSLSVADIIGFFFVQYSPYPVLRASYNWNNLYFSLLSNFSGGVVGGFLIGAASRLYLEGRQED